ncbi:MAG: ATP-binding cassette domain-containing protein [Patescibacteria group bacterium]|nr:ATP-binding cassette domain-containing protein [Patescibacteria group bacterium]
MIKVENISKAFGFVKAVDDLSFEIKQGEIVGFLGPNGAGKTTTMRILTGFLSPDKGSVAVNNISMEKDPTGAQKYIGYLPENNPLYQDMQVSELLTVAADLNNIPKSKRRDAFDFVVSSVKIESVFYRPISELSKGYKQRVGIAAALIHQPKIIIMDEPTEGLDPNQRTEIRLLIGKLAKNHTIIISTHVMQEASAMCNRLLIINKGKLVADGTTAELSQAARKEHSLQIEIEGENVESAIKTIGILKNISIESNINNRISATLAADRSNALQPELSRLAQKNNWIVWKLVEKEYKLEDIFQQLTEE